MTSAKTGAGKGGWAIAGALVAAVLSSACCWLPLTLLALGASAGGAGAVFESYRLPLLAITAVLLGASFYVVYFRKPTCAPGNACAAPNKKLMRFNRAMLWLATCFAATFALFPEYVSFLMASDDVVATAQATTAGAATASSTTWSEAPAAGTRVYTIEGMSCAGCTAHVEQELGKIAGVAAVTVSYEHKAARVAFAPGTEPNDAAVVATLEEELGLTARRAQRD